MTDLPDSEHDLPDSREDLSDSEQNSQNLEDSSPNLEDSSPNLDDDDDFSKTDRRKNPRQGARYRRRRSIKKLIIEEEGLSPSTVDAFKVPEFPVGDDWYSDGQCTNWDSFIKNKLGESYLEAAMERMMTYPVGPSMNNKELVDLTLSNFLNDKFNRRVSARIMQLIGYMKKNKSAAANLFIIRSRCVDVIEKFQAHVAHIDKVIEAYTRREARIVAEKDYLKYKLSTTRSARARAQAEEQIRNKRKDVIRKAMTGAFQTARKTNQNKTKSTTKNEQPRPGKPRPDQPGTPSINPERIDDGEFDL